ncbi:glycosyltransferase family 4 protein [Thiocapsa roseopersicina]|uniref:Glycosyltransferase involved in cell wall bisynthesis n=1 Tax=Thiocapsa roseopersicina TaxID=1058 RepID=A0A1H2Y433_THIRO|nr:glycosyltransferase family 4 protein [Thiocapsa roseopersicina]SDW99963.1 Glycosyltransferase involved in cell wall bisynthesis [Thiocapsa roseopersicina]
MRTRESSENEKIHVAVLGVRGLPGVPGGVESHCEQLYPLVAKRGLSVTVISRKRFSPPEVGRWWSGVRIAPIWCPRRKGAEAFIHTLLGVFYAAWMRPDVLHIHSIGPGLLTPLAKVFGLRVVVTYHASDYRQEKWGLIGKWILKLGEKTMMEFADSVISVSYHGAGELEKMYKRRPVVIANGVPRIDEVESTGVLGELGLLNGEYVLHVGRAIPDKRQLELIDAFSRIEMPGWKLVLVGDFPSADAYSDRVRERALQVGNVVLAGKRTGLELWELFNRAGCFTMPSSYEGLPIALLEAISAGLPTVASNIEANLEVGLPEWAYFDLDNIDAMARAMIRVIGSRGESVWRDLSERVRAEHDWEKVADAVVAEYRRVGCSS